MSRAKAHDWRIPARFERLRTAAIVSIDRDYHIVRQWPAVALCGHGEGISTQKSVTD